MDNLVKITLLGDITSELNSEWNLCVKSVKEAIHSINILTKNKFSNYFIKNNKLQTKYRVIINGSDFICPVNELNESNLEMAYQSELVMKKDNLKTIDIVPFIENNDSKTLGLVLGIVLIVVGLIISFFSGAAIGVPLIIAGIGIGIAALLSKPPDTGKPGAAEKAGKESYLFGGPINIIGEGGPIPLAYGRILAGSQVISSAYQIRDYTPN